MRNAVCTRSATRYGLMQIPAPMMPPITAMVVPKRPRWRARPLLGDDVGRGFYGGVTIGIRVTLTLLAPVRRDSPRGRARRRSGLALRDCRIRHRTTRSV